MIVVGSTLFAVSFYYLSFNSAFYFASNKAIELLKPVEMINTYLVINS